MTVVRVVRRSVIDGLVDGVLAAGRGFHRPPRDVWETNEGLVVAWDLPGLGIADVELLGEGATVTLRARREGPADAVRVHAWNTPRGPIEDSLELPDDVSPEGADARMKDGRLVVLFPFRGGPVLEGSYQVAVEE